MTTPKDTETPNVQQQLSDNRIKSALDTGDCSILTDGEAIRVMEMHRARMKDEARSSTNIGLAWKIMVSVAPANRWQLAEGVLITAGTAGLGYYLSTLGYGTVASLAPPVVGTAAVMLLNNMMNDPDTGVETLTRAGKAVLFPVKVAWHLVRPWNWKMFSKEKKAAIRAIQGLQEEWLNHIRQEITDAGVALEIVQGEIFSSTALTPEELQQAKALINKLDKELVKERTEHEQAATETLAEAASQLRETVDPKKSFTKAFRNSTGANSEKSLDHDGSHLNPSPA